MLTEEPAFVGCLNTFRSYGAKLVGIPMEQDGMNINALEEALKANSDAKLLYTIPSFQNPTGITTSLEKRKKVYELCCKYDIAILEDNPYGELRFAGENVPTIKSMDTEGMDSAPFVREAINRGVLSVPGAAFLADESQKSNGFRLNYSTPSDEQIVKGIEILGKLTYEWIK